MARTSSILAAARSCALALAMGAAVLAPAAFAADSNQSAQSPQVTVTRSVGSVEGYGGMAGRVGPQTTIRETQQVPANGSVEGYGGLAGRVGPGTNATSGVAQNAR